MKRVVFAEGEEEKIIRAALNFRELGLGIPILVGRQERIEDTLKKTNNHTVLYAQSLNTCV